MSQSRSFVAACKDFFGFKQGQTLSDFSAELKELTYNDKMEIAAGLRNIGLPCADPQAREGDNVPQAVAA